METIMFSQKDGFADIEAERFDSGVTIIVTDHTAVGQKCTIILSHTEAEELGKWLAARAEAGERSMKSDLIDITVALTSLRENKRVNADLVAALDASRSWIDRWTGHVGNCKGGTACTCGRTAILFDADTAIAKATNGTTTESEL